MTPEANVIVAALSDAVSVDALACGAASTRFSAEADDRCPDTLAIQPVLRVIGDRTERG